VVRDCSSSRTRPRSRTRRAGVPHPLVDTQVEDLTHEGRPGNH
jgi:hypothetical protein